MIAGALWEFPPAVCGQHGNQLSIMRSKRWSVESYKEFQKLAQERGNGVHMAPTNFYFGIKIEDDWLEHTKMRELKKLSEDEEIQGFRRITEEDLKKVRPPSASRTDTSDTHIGKEYPPIQEMFARNKRFAPELLKDVNLDDDVDVIAGLRPYRVENVCVEKEYGFNIVHNYGHGGSGFSLSYGCAREAIGLLESMEGPSFRVVDLRPAAVHQHPDTYAELQTPDFTTAQLDGQEVSVEQPVYH
ncbi:FAD-dependent oxidoreductase [Streptomyces anulatus]|nr:FAD-dependent oxidoreductase [Streptomyces anulatus]NDZ61121.1 FAD-binding oxidoreductase [Streptomyces anulatus]